VAILASGLLGFVACDRWIFAVRGGETDGHWPPTDRPVSPGRGAGAPVLVPVLAPTRRRRPWSR
jgi:hypothetical protein